MKRSIFSAPRWFVILILSLLLCGAGALNAFALPVEPAEPMPARVSLGADPQEAGPPAPAVDADAPAIAAEAAAPAAVTGIDDGLLAYWKLDETSGNPYDSGPRHWATYIYDDGAGGFSTDHAPTFFANSGSLNCIPTDATQMVDGFYTDDYMQLGGTSTAPESFTVAAWAKRPASTSGRDTLMSLPGYGNALLYMAFTSDNKFVCGFDDDTGTNDLYTAGAVEASAWHHWACTYNATTNLRQIWRDGVVIAADTATADFHGDWEFSVGVFNGQDWIDPYSGWIDDVRVYTRELSATEMQVLGQTKQRPIAYWKLDSSSDITPDDSSESGLHDLVSPGSPWSRVSGGAPTAFANPYHISLPAESSLHLESFLQTPDAPDLRAYAEVSVAAWVKLAAASSDRGILRKGLSYSLSIAHDEATSTNQASAYWSSGGIGRNIKGGAVPAGEWTHVAMTYRKGDMARLFVNGVEVNSTSNYTGQYLVQDNSPVTLGLETDCHCDYCGAIEMDDVRVYNRTISPEEVAGLAGEGAQAYWRLDNDLNDASGNGHTLAGTGFGRTCTSTLGSRTHVVREHSLVALRGLLFERLRCDGSFGDELRGVALVQDHLAGCRHLLRNQRRPQLLRPRHLPERQQSMCARLGFGRRGGDLHGRRQLWLRRVAPCRPYVRGAVGAQRLYVDGVLAATGTLTASGYTSTGQNVHIGLAPASDRDGDGFRGSVDEVRVFRRALTEREVTELYAGPCYARPEDALEGSDGTVYSSLSAAAVQGGVDLLGIGGGTVKLSGACVGTTTRSEQHADGPDLHRNSPKQRHPRRRMGQHLQHPEPEQHAHDAGCRVERPGGARRVGFRRPNLPEQADPDARQHRRVGEAACSSTGRPPSTG